MRTKNLKKNLRQALLPVFALLLICAVQACKKSRSDLGKILFTETGNKVFKNVENEAFAAVFRKTLEAQQATLSNPKLITAFYEKNGYEPVLVQQHVQKKGLETMLSYFEHAGDHGLSPDYFKAAQYKALVDKLYAKDALATTDEAYQEIAKLEIMTANSLINYSNALQYGVVNPRKIYAAYYAVTKRPDSSSMNRVFAAGDIKAYLDSIQPKDKQYLALQKVLKDHTAAPGISQEETEKIIRLNLERLRWRNKPAEKKYVIVNIADFRLDVMQDEQSVLNMKVCVGEGRNKDFTDNLQEYDENDLKKDRPFSRETPQLNSLIHSVQVNPVWNIPQSIATNEITKYAAADRYYLSNHNIDVFENGKKVEDPELINWSEGNPGKKYQFKQRPGDENSLGKIKFLFNNQSSVYLHDTPAKAAFNRSMRAVSHGCVRLEKPLELAHALFGDGAKYEKIAKLMADTVNEATDIALPAKVPVYLTYITAWTDPAGTVQLRKDVYGLDIVLYTYLTKTGAV